MQTRHTPRVQVLVAGQAVDAPAIRHDPSSFQQQIAAARAGFGSALCTCRNPPLKLVIRERDSHLFLAAWPNQAESHSVDCPFYSEARSGASHYAAGAIEAHGATTRIQLAHPLQQAPRVDGAPSAESSRAPNGQKARLHLWGLLHHLWEGAGMNRWRPGWTRDWGMLRYQIRRVAQSTDVEGASLITNLYIPPIWVRERSTEIEAHWQQFCAPLFKNHRGSERVASAFVLGTVRNLEQSEYGHVLLLHHHATKFFIDDTVSDLLARFSRRGWAAAKHLAVAAQPGEKPQVVAAVRVEATSNARLKVVEAALMRVSPRFIPVNSSWEDRLARILVEADREFVRPLHYDNHGVPLPHFILRDIQPERCGGYTAAALHVYGASIESAQATRIQVNDRREAANHGLHYWSWDAASKRDPPDLPPLRSRSASQQQPTSPGNT